MEAALSQCIASPIDGGGTLLHGPPQIHIPPMKLLSLLTLAVLLSTPFAHSAEVKAVSAKYVIGKGKNALPFPLVASPLHTESVTRTATREILFPTKWVLPSKKEMEGNQIIVPLIPTDFEKEPVGWAVRWSADMADGLILLTGVVEFTDMIPTKGVYGEQSGPVYSGGKPRVLLTKNVTKTMGTSKTATPFQINALPGKTYEIKVKRLDKWVPVSVTCEVIKASSR